MVGEEGAEVGGVVRPVEIGEVGAVLASNLADFVASTSSLRVGPKTKQ